MDYCARLSTLEESHRFLNREFMQISDTWTKAALLSKGLLTKAASIMPPLSTFCPFRPLAHFLCQSRFDARSPVHTNYLSFVSRLHSGRAGRVSLAKEACFQLFAVNADWQPRCITCYVRRPGSSNL